MAAPREQERQLPTGTPGESRSGAGCNPGALSPVTACPAAAVGSSTSPSPSRWGQGHAAAPQHLPHLVSGPETCTARSSWLGVTARLQICRCHKGRRAGKAAPLPLWLLNHSRRVNDKWCILPSGHNDPRKCFL